METNTSRLIDPKSCRTCGKCCKTFSLCYPKSLKKVDPTSFSEVKRFSMLDTTSVEVKDLKNSFVVEFKFKCKHLKFDNGEYSCEIYETNKRPVLCKGYPFEMSEDCPNKIEEKKT